MMGFMVPLSQISTLNCFETLTKTLKGVTKIMGYTEHEGNSSKVSRKFLEAHTGFHWMVEL